MNNRFKLQFKTKLIIWLIVAFVVTVPSYLMSRQVVPIGKFTFRVFFFIILKIIYLLKSIDLCNFINLFLNYCIFIIKGILYNHVTGPDFLYGVTNNFLGNNLYVTIGLFALSLLRGFFMYILLLVISVWVIFKFRNHLKHKATVIRDQHNELPHGIQNQSDKNKNKNKKKDNRVTKMVLSMSLNYIIGTFLGSLSPILFQIGVSSTVYAYYGTVANLVSYLSHGTYILWYYKFNPKFKKVFLETFCVESQQHPVYNGRPRMIKATSKQIKSL